MTRATSEDYAKFPLITRDEAIAKGMKRFKVENNKCCHGHDAPRYVKDYRCVQCALNNWARYRDSDPASYDAKVRSYRARNPAYTLWRNARHRAKIRNLEFSITKDDVIVYDRCPCCDTRMQLGLERQPSGSPSFVSASLDRIDSSKGYIPGNVNVICFRCNVLKSDGTIKEFENLLKYMRDRLCAVTITASGAGYPSVQHLKLISGEKS